MADDLDAEIEEPAKPDPGAAMFLALYLMLLAFFIVLNTLSTLDEVRSKTIMDNLSTTFTQLLPPNRLDTFTSQVGDVVDSQSFEEELTNLFETAIPAAEITLVQPGTALQVSFHPDALFFPGTTTIRPGRRPLLDRIIAAMNASPEGLQYRMEMVIGLGGAPDEEIPTAQTPQSARAGAFAREVLRRGLPPETLLVGIDRTSSHKLRIMFQIVDEDYEDIDFSAVVTGGAGRGS